MKTKRRKPYSADEKKRLLRDVEMLQQETATVKDACHAVGITRKQYYQWRKQALDAEQGDAQALEPKSKKPQTFANECSQQVIQQIIDRAKTGNYRSANAIHKALAEQELNVSTQTIIRVLEDAGFYGFETRENAKGEKIKVKTVLVSDSGNN